MSKGLRTLIRKISLQDRFAAWHREVIIDRGKAYRSLKLPGWGKWWEGHPEAREQARFVDFLLDQTHPWSLAWAAIPNDAKRGGKGITLARLLGIRRGVPDLFLMVAAAGYHGLWLEFKRGQRRATEAQLLWHELLRQQGYRVEVVDYAAAVRVFEEYRRGVR